MDRTQQQKDLLSGLLETVFQLCSRKGELDEVQKIVKAQPSNSVLVLTDLRDTNVGSDLLPAMNAASAATKDHVRRTAVLGVTGIKRKLADLLSSMTGQALKYFDDAEAAKKWLAED